MRFNPLGFFKRTLLKDETSLLHINKKAEQVLRLLAQLHHDRGKMLEEIARKGVLAAEREYYPKLRANIEHDIKISRIVQDNLLEARAVVRDVRKKLAAEKDAPVYLVEAVGYLEDVFKEVIGHMDFLIDRRKMHEKNKKSFRSLIGSIESTHIAERKRLDDLYEVFDPSRIHDLEKRMKEAEDRLRAISHTVKYVMTGAGVGALTSWAFSGGGENGFPPSTPEEVRNAVLLVTAVGAAIGLFWSVRHEFGFIRGYESSADRERAEQDIGRQLETPWKSK